MKFVFIYVIRLISNGEPNNSIGFKVFCLNNALD